MPGFQSASGPTTKAILLKVIQLSDCHVTGSTGTPYRGQDPRASLSALVDRVIAWSPDLVLATGDLSEDASEASYAFLVEQFERINAPLWVTAGNHDDARVMAHAFTHSVLHEPVRVHDGAWQIILLNSARDGDIAGRLDQAQLEVLKDMLRDDDRPALLALHHQPWPVASPWIDRYPLTDPGEFIGVLNSGPARQLVLWGHVHQAIHEQHILPSGRVVDGLAGPSTVCNSLPNCTRFTPDPEGPACRWLALESNGNWQTGLLRPRAGPARE